MATIPGLKYVVLFFDGIGPSSPVPQEPTADNTAGTMDDAVALFRKMVRESGRDGVPTDGGGPWADIDATASWDGVSYGDGHLVRLTLGKRGGVIRQSW